MGLKIFERIDVGLLPDPSTDFAIKNFLLQNFQFCFIMREHGISFGIHFLEGIAQYG